MTTEHPCLEAVRQEHETFLADLESLVVNALVTQNWVPVYDHLATVTRAKEVSLQDCFKSEEDFVDAIALINRLLHGEAITKDLPRPGDGFSSQLRKRRSNPIMPHSTEELAQRYTELSKEAGDELNRQGETSRYEQIKADADQLYEFVPESQQANFVRQIHNK